MVRTTKPIAPVSASPAAPAVVADVKATAPKKTPKAAAPKKEKAPVAEVAAPVVVAPVVATTPALETTPAVATDLVVESNSITKLNEIDAKIQQLSSIISTLKGEVKVLAKTIVREQKVASKSTKASRRASGNRQPSGFVKPTRISDELASFLGKSAGSEMARTEVSKEINQYIRQHNLQDKANGRKINPDSKLSTLLKIQNGDELTYFNLQRFMKHHFIKPTVTATA
jgi:chromatin remodeling complex protein RSC6